MVFVAVVVGANAILVQPASTTINDNADDVEQLDLYSLCVATPRTVGLRTTNDVVVKMALLRFALFHRVPLC